MTSKPIMLMLVALFVQQTSMAAFVRHGDSIVATIFALLAGLMATLAIISSWME